MHSAADLCAEGHGLKDMLIAGELDPDRPTTHDASPTAALPSAVRHHLGMQLQAAYQTLITTEPPQRLLDLLEQLDRALSIQDRESASAFRHGLTEALPALRGFAMSLVASNEARADDLVQETLLKAWAKQETFVPGTNLKAWLFTILRNHFYSEVRKYKREVEDADGTLAGQLQAPASQEHGSDLRTIWTYIAKIPPSQREALLLVGAQGLTYEAAAEVMGCQVGTAKSRVSRARALLGEMLGMSQSWATA